jgi:plasmid stabilization system protein ParE
MNRPISIHETTENELNDAADFYDLESPGLGEAFINEIHKAIDLIARFPEASLIIRGRIRRKVLIKFPYALIYSLRATEIRILAIAHQKRRPIYWRGRL